MHKVQKSMKPWNEEKERKPNTVTQSRRVIVFFICISIIFFIINFIRCLCILQYTIQYNTIQYTIHKNKKSIHDTIHILTTMRTGMVQVMMQPWNINLLLLCKFVYSTFTYGLVRPTCKVQLKYKSCDF